MRWFRHHEEPRPIIERVWLRDPANGVDRPVPVRMMAIPRVGDQVLISPCDRPLIHGTFWRVSLVAWTDTEPYPRVDVEPMYR